jgi:phosphoglycerol transferase MdoB-like AlkP superfamily enzyme
MEYEAPNSTIPDDLPQPPPSKRRWFRRRTGGPASPPPKTAWKQSRYAFAAVHLAWLLVVWLVLRFILVLKFSALSTLTPLDGWRIFDEGLHRDALIAVALTIPLLFWFWLLPNSWFRARWHRWFFRGAYFVASFLMIFFLFVEYYFFEEFKSRFNTVAVDYLLYPHEVFINIWQSYPLLPIVAICLLLTAGWFWFLRKLFREMWYRHFSFIARSLYLLCGIGAAVLLDWQLPFKGAHISTDRAVNEMANNGVLAFTAAAWTHHLDYGAYYKTNNLEEAYQRARRLLAERTTQFVEDGPSLRRRVAGDASRPRLNVVIFLEESLGSEFWGCLGRRETCTPEMDKLAEEEGLLFTDMYASGNRTVRGMEGVLSSFPPLPGDSIVKRDLSDNVETIARVLKRDGYATAFLYGGRGIFDGMRSYAVRNGYDRFIEQKDFPQPTFTTIWGVCDEDLFNRALEEFRTMAKDDKPFFATILSVSNHKPFTFPKGRIPEDPDRRKREYAVKYSDYALGQFFRAAKKEAFWTNTIFAVVADHGARVYGKQSIPIESYEIPLVILGPAVVNSPARIRQLGCSLDVSPTILGLIGRPYETMFFGHDLLTTSPGDGRVLLNHNRDIGMLAHDRLVVLGLMQTVEFYEGNPKLMDLSIISQPGNTDREIEKDTIALYQVADDLYTHQRYRIDGEPKKGATPPASAAAAR